MPRVRDPRLRFPKARSTCAGVGRAFCWESPWSFGAIDHESQGERQRCEATNRNGRPCRNFPSAGKRRCKFHGGAPGSGRPPSTFLYRRHLDDEQKAAFDSARIGSLDLEIRLAKANLDSATQRWQEDPDGGIIVSSGKQTTYRLWVDILRDHIETVRRLEEARRRIMGEDHGDALGAIRRLMEKLDGPKAAE